LDVAVGLGEDATAEELDEAARLLRGELADAGLGEVALADGGAAPEGTRAGGGFLAGALTLDLLPGAVGGLMALVHDWTSRRPGRTLRLAYGTGEGRLELEYDPDKTDINQVMVLLLTRTAGGPAVAAAGTSAGGDVVGGDKVSHVSAGADAVGRDKITEIHAAAGAVLIFNDPRAQAPKLEDSEPSNPDRSAPDAADRLVDDAP
jgi:hypothetical protein